MIGGWIERMHSVTAADAANALGLKVQDPRGAGGGSISPCPKCGQETRHSKTGDKRGAVGISANGVGWKCWQCDAAGDSLDLVAFAKHGARFRDLQDGHKRDVREWCGRQWPSVAEAMSTNGSSPSTATRAVAPTKAPEYPPVDEVRALWESCEPVTANLDVVAWLRNARSIPPERVAELGAARVIGASTKLFKWSALGPKSWRSTGHILIVPLFDAAGEMRSVIARRVPDPPKGSDVRKSLAAKGFARVGLVMASGYALAMLRPLEDATRGVDAFTLVVTEGEVDFLSWLTEDPTRLTHAIGTIQGAWSDAVAKKIPKGSTVVIATDLDEPGEKYAAKVVKSLGPDIVAQRWPLERTGTLNDANDYRRAGVALEASGKPLAASKTRPKLEGWQALLSVDSKGKIQKTAHNAILILVHDPEWEDVIRYDERRDRVFFAKAPPLHDDYAGAAASYPRDIVDADSLRIAAWIERKMGASFNPDLLTRCVDVVALRNAVDPVRDWLSTLAWDGVERLDGWLAKYMGARDDVFSRAVGSKWMIGAVARAFVPGCKVDHVLVLEGDQGTFKSTALSILAGPDHFTDQVPTMGTKDASVAMQGPWIVELAELDAMSRSEVAAVKAFITVTSDDYRSPYGRRNEKHPRRCVFAATTNEASYLKDSTGNRRFWPIACGAIDLDALRADRGQLWAEARARFAAGEAWYLTGVDERAAAVEAQEERYQADAWEATIARYLESPMVVNAGWTTVAEVLSEALKIEIGRQGKPEQTRAGAALTRLGWRSRRTTIAGSSARQRVYEPISTQLTLSNVAEVGQVVHAPKVAKLQLVGQPVQPVQPIPLNRAHTRAPELGASVGVNGNGRAGRPGWTGDENENDLAASTGQPPDGWTDGEA